MTVTYSLEYANSGLGCFLKLLFRWKGSIYKLMWKEMVIFIALYYFLSIIYRFCMTDEQQLYIPLTFMLGFYVHMVVDRFHQTFSSLPWPDQAMLLLSAYMPGNDESTRIARRTIARYLSLSNILVLRDISTVVRKRFPTMEHIVNAGFMTEEEYEMYEDFPYPQHKYWMVIQWALTVLEKSLKEGSLKSERSFQKICEEIVKYRGSIAQLISFDWISLPLVYTQVVTIAVHSFFLACLFGRQLLKPDAQNISDSREKLDLYVPVFTILQFVFYMGWFKVAETLINPLGEDDDDFELNYLIDRHIQISLLIVDRNNYMMPSLTRDPFWDEEVPEIPHTCASIGVKDRPRIGSAVPLNVPRDAAEQFLPSECDVLSMSDQSGASSLGLRRLLSVVSFQSNQRKASRISLPSRKTSRANRKVSWNLAPGRKTGRQLLNQFPQRRDMKVQQYLTTLSVDPPNLDCEKNDQILDFLAAEGNDDACRKISRASMLGPLPEEDSGSGSSEYTENRLPMRLDVTRL